MTRNENDAARAIVAAVDATAPLMAAGQDLPKPQVERLAEIVRTSAPTEQIAQTAAVLNEALVPTTGR